MISTVTAILAKAIKCSIHVITSCISCSLFGIIPNDQRRNNLILTFINLYKYVCVFVQVVECTYVCTGM